MSLKRLGSELLDLSGFKIESLLNTDSRSNRLTFLGHFGADEDSKVIVSIGNRPVDNNNLISWLESGPALKPVLQNDIYGSFLIPANPNLSEYKVDITFPATDLHIKKAQAQKLVIVSESAEDYNNVLLPFITSLPESRLQWVYNILEKKKEVERMIFHDPDSMTGFMLHPDQKWDCTDLETLYCVAIVNRRDLQSIRDLNASHIALLENVYKQGCAVLEEKFGLKKSQLRVYFHYIPSYYHLHIHFTNVHFDVGGQQNARAHSLLDVLNNIKIDSDYYKKASLTCVVVESHPLAALTESEYV